MSAPPSASRSRSPRLAWLRWTAAALALGVAIGAGIALLRGNGQGSSAVSTLPAHPAATWAAGAKRAPDFRLSDPNGAPVSLSGYRGRPVIVTFIDPVCTSLCPLEAQQLEAALASFPASKRPPILAVSVNPWAQTRAAFRKDDRKWRLPPQWHWAAGGYSQLAPVWKHYAIGVLDRKRTVDGITVHNVAHTEAAYLVDSAGYQRALFLYPFVGRDVAAALKPLVST
jgi:cytochrome oxidase Cu insertion factor (SCO1/SenC/PrrC family)